MDLNIPSWDDMFMNQAYQIALKSKEPRTKLGAVIVRNKVAVSMGYNGIPRGVRDLPERYERGKKDPWMAHAEMNAILNASRIGASLEGCTIYTPRLPCTEKGCAIAIIQAGIVEVVLDYNWVGREADAERDELSLVMFGEAGVNVRFHPTKYLLPETVNDGVICDLV